MELSDRIKQIPHNPGVYLMKDINNKIIYVGKAKDLKNRVSSYFNKTNKDIKTSVLVKKVKSIDFIVTRNELEALILESNLIKKHLPKYNVLLKDDKRYPFIQITIKEDYPRVLIVRERKNDGNLYFGPYTNVKYMRETLKLIHRIFPVRKCNKILNIKYKGKDIFFKPVGKPCLNYQIKQCVAPCQGKVAPEEYKKIIDDIVLFLKGENNTLIQHLEERMKVFSENMEFEKAAEVRDKIFAIKKVMERQNIVTNRFNSQDVISVKNKEDIFNITILFIRDGKIMGKNNFIIKEELYKSKEYILKEFIKQYYISPSFLPEEIIIPIPLQEKELIESLIREKKGENIIIRVYNNEVEQKLMEMAEENATIELSNYLADKEIRDNRKAILQLQKSLNLKRIPHIIEGFDISNIQGKLAVGSMVRFEDGIPIKNEYRKFKIKSVEGIDDFKMIYEVVFRRYKRILNEKKSFPDLILIDGGKGQLSSAIEALNSLGIKNQPIISLAKKEELIFFPYKKEPLKLPRNSRALKLLQRVRDEAHRFAISFHKRLREKEFLKSELDSIKGIGNKIKVKIFEKFGSVENAKKADIQELMSIKGITEDIARKIKYEIK